MVDAARSADAPRLSRRLAQELGALIQGPHLHVDHAVAALAEAFAHLKD